MASITKRNGSYRVRIYQGNNQSISKSFARESQAIEWLRVTKAQLELGIYEPAKPKKLTPAMSFKEAAERYIATHTIHKRNQASEAGILKILIKRWDGLSIQQITKQSVLSLRDDLLRLGRSHSTINHYFNSISKLYQMLTDELDISIPIPTKEIKRMSAKPGRIKRIQGQMEEILLATCHKLGYHLLSSIIQFAIATGMRRGEIIGLKWSDIDLVNRRAYLHTTKNGESRIVPLSSLAVTALSNLNQRDDGLVFPMSFATLKRQYTKVRNNAYMSWGNEANNPFKDLRFHDLRHEALSRMSDLGLNVIELSHISGHKTLAMLARYTHPSHEAIFNKLDA